MANATFQNQQGSKSVPTSMGLDVQPLEGPRVVGVNFDFTTTPVVNFNASFSDCGMSLVQSIYIDNRNNASAVTFQMVISNQFVTVPPYSQAFFPVMIVGKQTVGIIGSSSGAVVVPVFLMNTYTDPMIWNANAITIGGTITVNGTTISQPYSGAYVDRSLALAAANTSQALMPVNGARRRFFIQNPSTAAGQGIGAAESIFLDFTTAAGVNNGKSIELQPGQSLDSGMGPVTTELINVIATTIGHKIIAKEI